MQGFYDKDLYRIAREKMVKSQIVARGIKDEKVIQAMLKVPRHLFVEEALRDQAYGDFPLPIGKGQTISQPYIVALMTEALELKGKERVLEVGTGSGYQTAILAEIALWVYTIERDPDLSEKAKKVLLSLGYKNISLKIGDGSLGWPEAAPFDAIIVTAASPQIPQPLVDQLAEGGRIVIPVGDEFSQILVKGIKKDGILKIQTLEPVRFVKLVGAYGFKE
ncbi:MAG: Protein-L-isoaspartate O-methyltransferase [Thermodesulfobacterium sp. 37_54]|jgi:protein-L-isoaspartate(D-aspartate) O-methyltransferase|uniref:Protein-L-isoaspartate O-methyltransferase n=2 Tax=Thermodesulfobacterium commune TaxID=1741 RepID=A0A075WS29_9BACT|nr:MULTISPECIES: protein-L-isoaspartate(D-aspartate) O-methyltransferase [Thermodesulfobacterium]KUJ97471.1 MAG: Protein-L-isoaspartate O-methyltransferase [Thermodesulfobacterium sp. 37_54]MDK2862119.1 protein-L-isoaspartate(D-aspartate) O-methyltransferase [Thermodesulfobacterium sp.]HBT03613.1 protein-L-isoaspartate(D-aspartate) O-methyltransferase [Thermodesulfobacterium commune]AIH03840.1 protein-L-isoaspartate O-methyltransferase [Thermodesulfobacterium commune DSM 2178]HCP09394.1 protei